MHQSFLMECLCFQNDCCIVTTGLSGCCVLFQLSLCTALDVSGSMGSPFEQDAAHGTKLDVAKKCLQTLTDQLKPR